MTCKCGAYHDNRVAHCDACLEAMTVRVGTMTIPEAFDCEESFESAAQYRTVRVKAGEYPIFVKVSRFDARRYVAVELSGVVTHSGYGSKRYTEEIGTVRTVRPSYYKYQLRAGKLYHGTATITDSAAFEAAQGV